MTCEQPGRMQCVVVADAANSSFVTMTRNYWGERLRCVQHDVPLSARVRFRALTLHFATFRKDRPPSSESAADTGEMDHSPFARQPNTVPPPRLLVGIGEDVQDEGDDATQLPWQWRTTQDLNACLPTNDLSVPDAPVQTLLSLSDGGHLNQTVPDRTSKTMRAVSTTVPVHPLANEKHTVAVVASGVVDHHHEDVEYERKTRRRENCRVNQARYRKRQRQRATDLESYIQTLRAEVKELEKRRAAFPFSEGKKQDVWTVASEYFRLLSHEVGSVTGQREPSALAFLQTAMADNVRDGDLCGPEALYDNWRRFSRCFDNVHVELKRLEKCADDLLIATTTTSFTLSGNSLHHVFPCLTSRGELPPLATRLLGRRMVLHGSVRFEWEAETERVARIHSQSDLLTPVLRLLGSLEDVSHVFEGALVSPDGRLEADGDRFRELVCDRNLYTPDIAHRNPA